VDTGQQMARRVAAFACLVVLGAAPAQAAEHPQLATARALYNAANYDGAISAASESRRLAQWADASALVIARSHLELFRLRSNPADLTAAREALRGLRPASLTPRDQVDLLIGHGQALYFGEFAGAAAELFDTALARGSLLGARDRQQLLDWWASALDRDAQSRPLDRREPVYERILRRMEEEVQIDAGNPTANYWLAVAARGSGDLDRAWHAAVAAWVRASFAPDRAARLREDLDQLVTQALISDRVRARPGREQPDALASLRAEWELVKETYP
jgi:hypothetical protein